MSTSRSCLLLQTDEAEKLDEEAADKPAGKNSLPSVPDCYQEVLTGVAFRTVSDFVNPSSVHDQNKQFIISLCNYRAFKCSNFPFPVFVASRFRRGEEQLVKCRRDSIPHEQAVVFSSETKATNPRDKPAYFGRRRAESSNYYALARRS